MDFRTTEPNKLSIAFFGSQRQSIEIIIILTVPQQCKQTEIRNFEYCETSKHSDRSMALRAAIRRKKVKETEETSEIGKRLRVTKSGHSLDVH